MLLALAGILVLSPCGLRAQSAEPAPAADPGIEIVGNASDGIEVSPAKTQSVKVRLKNTSARRLVVTHAALGSSGALLAIRDIDLAPGDAKPLELLVEGEKVLLPGSIRLVLRVKDGKDERTVLLPLQFTSKDVFVFQPRSITWKVGDEPKPRVVKLANIPAGKTVTGVKLSDDAFTAKLENGTITVTPPPTTEPRTATLTLLTEPASAKPVTLFVSVVAKQAARPTNLPKPPPAQPSAP